ncbi:MAG: hypothetical protein V1647_04885 [Pseudomonadota bacterium]
MKVSEFVKFAKQAQSVLKKLNKPAEHIYVVTPSGTREVPSLVFISREYDNMDIYNRAQLASFIQKGPLKINYCIVGPKHISSYSSSVTREDIYRAVKIYGKKPLTLNGVEYASGSEAVL